MKVFYLVTAALAIHLCGCTSSQSTNSDPKLGHDGFPRAEAELREAVEAIRRDIIAGNIEGLQAAHLVSEKFTKFGPRRFERQDVAGTNDSEAAFFSSISNVTYDVEDLKIDVFGEVGVVTYYPHVSFTRDDQRVDVVGRQTFVFLHADGEWKLVHEHGTPQNPNW